MSTKPNSQATLLIAAACLALLVVVCGGGAVLFFAMTWRVKDAAERIHAEKAEAAKRMTREEFRKLLVGKTKDEVIAAVGRPEQTSDGVMSLWSYYDRTVDPVTGKVDAVAHVHFDRSGVVVRVNY